MSATPAGTLRIRWMITDYPDRVPPGRILLSWKPSADGRMDVTAHLGLPGAEVMLAAWPGLTGDWTDIVQPTVYEVAGLHSALTLATIVLEVLAD